MNRRILSFSSLFLVAAAWGSACGDGEADVEGPGLVGDGDGDGDGDGSCEEPRILCDEVCTAITIDPDHCGACGISCDAGEGCLDGTCADFGCPTGQVACDGECVDLMGSFAHCGGCGDACDSGQVCDDGQCESACPPTFLLCDGNCIDPSKDRAYCGATSCDDVGGGGAGGAGNATVCVEGELCFGGHCLLSCPDSLLACDGTCIDPRTDLNHCGATDCEMTATSGISCAEGEACAAGACKRVELAWSSGIAVNGNGTTAEATGHLVEADEVGNAIAVWTQQAGAVFQAYGSYFFHATRSWTAPERFDTSTQGVRQLTLDMASNGRAAVAWAEGEIDDSIVVVRRFEPSTRSWLDGERVDSSPGTSESPSIGIAESGDVVVAWSQKMEDGSLLIARNHFDAEAASWSGEDLFSAYGQEAPARRPRLDANEAGDAALIWWEGTGSGPYQARASVYDVEDGSWSSPGLLKAGSAPSQALSVDAGGPEVGIDEEGNAYAVWSQTSGGSQDIWASKFSGIWSEPQVIEDEDNSANCIRPQIATARDGSSIVVFEVGNDPGPFDVHASFLDGSLGFDEDTIAWGVGSSTQVHADIAADQVAHVVWLDSGDVKWAIRDEIGSWSKFVKLTSSNTPVAMDPVLAASSSGRVFAGWSQGSNYFLARFE